MATQVEYPSEVLYYISSQELDDDDEDEEVYRTNSGPGSTQDIWKKFELTGIPTPPLSPSRQAVSSGASSPTCLTTSAGDTLQSVSDILDVDNSRTTLLSPDNSCPNLKSKLIQDCMWGSNSTEKVQRVAYIENIYATPCSTPPPLDYVSADCVDPSSVFPYPINNQEFTSDSSEDEDEIDVVTIENAEKVRRKISAPKSPTHNNDDDDDDVSLSDSETVAKKPKMMLKRHRSIKEDTKDIVENPECKRTVHNVLERKRRNDLKYSFQILRDSVPDLKGSERAPKVAILKKATDCIHNLKDNEESLSKQKEHLMKKNQSLLRKLKLLQESAK